MGEAMALFVPWTYCGYGMLFRQRSVMPAVVPLGVSLPLGGRMFARPPCLSPPVAPSASMGDIGCRTYSSTSVLQSMVAPKGSLGRNTR